MTLLIVGCATGGKEENQDANWYSFFVVLFYMVSPIPFLLSKRYSSMGMGGNSNSCQELAIFLTIGVVISSFGLPIVLARHPLLNPVITASACWFTMGANIVVYLTIMGFFLTFGSDDAEYSMWWALEARLASLQYQPHLLSLSNSQVSRNPTQNPLPFVLA